MRYEISESLITFYFDNPKSHNPSSLTVSLSKTDLPIAFMADALCRQGFGSSTRSQTAYVMLFLKPLLHFFSQDDVTYPQTPEQWQILLLNFMRFYLLDQTYSKAAVKTRMLAWSKVFRIFKFWIEEEIIPFTVVIPCVDLKQERNIASEQQLLAKKINSVALPDKPLQKLLVDISFSETDENYLKIIEHECHKKIEILKRVCMEHFEAMKRDHLTGQEFALKISHEDIEKRIQNRSFTKFSEHTGKDHLVTSCIHPDGHIWILAKLKYKLGKGRSTDCISVKTLRQSPFFSNDVFKENGYTDAFKKITALPPDTFAHFNSAALFYRFSGILLGMDVAAACCLLTIEHPRFTSEALQNAKLLDVRGKSYLLSGNKDKHALFSVDKPRAGKRITVALTPFSQEIVHYIIKITQPLRAIMRECGDKAWRYLFLGLGKHGQFGAFQTAITYFFTHENFSSLLRLYPELSEHGFEKGNCDFRRIRNTMGVLRWFETGSIKETSRELGNTKRVVIEHYLPPTLLHAWNTRIIRRFQNTLIILAAHDEDYLLEVTDFSTMEDLLQFVAQLVYEYRDGSSPIAIDIHKRLGDRFRVETDAQLTEVKVTGEAILNLRLSKKSLGFLYAFADFASRHPDKEPRQHTHTSSPFTTQQFIDLANMIRHACESEECSIALRELLDIERLRCYHHAALAQQERLLTQFSRFSLINTWGESCLA